jgi:hypothetical protein
MYHGDDEPTEVLHIYVVREVVTPPLLPIVLSVMALSILIAFGVLSPNQQPVTRDEIRVPAVLLPIRTFTAQAPIIPTGVRTYPATTAHGVLTITNGSIIGQYIPAGFIIDGVATDRAVYVPPGSANGYGYATVSAHALIRGQGGNFVAFAINQVIGSSVYIRNLSAFTGGRDGYSVKFATAQDKQAALLQARGILLSKSSGLRYPCRELWSGNLRTINMTWRCQFVSYHIPALYHVTGVRLAGKSLLLDVWFVPRPAHIWVK